MYLGRRRQEGVNTNEISRNVRTIIVHPSYDSNTNNNDIALLQLSSTVTFNDYIKPVCLAAQSSVFSSGTSSWITGWGDVQAGGTNTYKPIHSSVYLLLTSLIDGCVCVFWCSVSLASPGILQETMVPVVDNVQCNALLGSGSVTSNMMCAGLTQGGQRHLPGTTIKFYIFLHSHCLFRIKCIIYIYIIQYLFNNIRCKMKPWCTRKTRRNSYFNEKTLEKCHTVNSGHVFTVNCRITYCFLTKL